MIYVVCPAKNLLEKVTTFSNILGLASIDDELFVLMNQVENQVAVYSVNDYQLLRHLNLPGFKQRQCSYMTSCGQNKCLYISGGDKACIRRHDLASGATSKWPVRGNPCRYAVCQ